MKTLTITALSLSLAAMPASALELLGYWNFDNQSEDQSDAGNDAVLADGAVVSPDMDGFSSDPGDYALDLGASGNAARADVALDLSAATANNAMAVSFRQNNADTAAATSTFWFTSGRALQAHIPWSDGTLYFDHANGAVAPETRHTIDGALGAGQITGGEWQHFVLQKDAAGNKQIYIDGVLGGEQTDGAAVPLAGIDGAVSIGSAQNGGISLGGQIDELAVFSQPLTQEQVTRLAEGAAAPEILQPPVPFVFTDLTIGGDGRRHRHFQRPPQCQLRRRGLR